MKKYIFLDIDGTLLDSKKQVSCENIKAMNELKKDEFEIVFCSGRNNDYLINLSKKTNTSNYIISSNGSMIYNQKENKIIHADCIPFHILKNIYNYCKKNKLAITFNTDKYRYYNDFYHQEKKDIKIINNINDINNIIVTQFVVGSYNYQKMIEVKEYIDNIEELEIVNISTTMKFKQINSKDGFFYDVVLKGINKGTGIDSFIKYMNISKKDCIAIGDHINDVDMFNATEYKIAMGNGYEELKKQADYIAKTNDDNGVVDALEHLQKKFL
ncbi:MAG: HAD family phosphatase [Bacilli bacterium]|nr:HAD family phosphatase [Bacilli bacterium]